jgi:WhiB family redox-sensing transcriptional regulator
VNWRTQALCKDRPDLDWDDETTDDTRRVCLACPVKVDCAVEGLRLKECIGTWAATSEQERRAIRRGRLTVSDVWRRYADM